MEETERRIGKSVKYCKNLTDCAEDADAIALMTEWKQFRLINWANIKSVMNGDIVVVS